MLGRSDAIGVVAMTFAGSAGIGGQLGTNAGEGCVDLSGDRAHSGCRCQSNQRDYQGVLN